MITISESNITTYHIVVIVYVFYADLLIELLFQ